MWNKGIEINTSWNNETKMCARLCKAARVALVREPIIIDRFIFPLFFYLKNVCVEVEVLERSVLKTRWH